MRALINLKPRILFVDVGLPRLRTVRELPAIQQLSPLTKVVVISDRPTTSGGVSGLGNTPERLLGDPPVAPMESTRKG
jgi:hypothetical protein